MYGGVLLAHEFVPSPWGDVSHFNGWWSFVSAEFCRGNIFALPLADVLSRVIADLAQIARQLTPVGWLVAIWGIVQLWRVHHDQALTSALSFALILIFAVGYNTADSIVYLTAVHPLGALLIAFGLTELGQRLSPAWRMLFLLFPFAQLVLFFRKINERRIIYNKMDGSRFEARAALFHLINGARRAHIHAMICSRGLKRAGYDYP